VGAKLESCWGPGDGRPVGELKRALDQMLEEFVLSVDVAEATRCILVS
jgi:programmed cell death protein 4